MADENKVTFGEWTEDDAIAAQQGEAISSLAKFAGTLARAFVGRGASAQAESPCPDAKPTDVITPCEQKRRELLAKAAAYKEDQRQKRMVRMAGRAA
jgi:hypothetical protein